MTLSHADSIKDSSSIYEKFKENTQKIFNEESFKEGLDKGHLMLKSRQVPKKGTIKTEIRTKVGISSLVGIVNTRVVKYTLNNSSKTFV